MDPNLRRKIKDNLSLEERAALKDIVKNFPELNLRIRKEDKGGRFCVVDGDTEDELLETDLGNNVHYEEIGNDPTEEFKEEVKEWADDCLENGVITEQMYKFVTAFEDTHPANPKPLFKTHKKDENGQTKIPCPIRNLTTACGTPVAKLSKLTQSNIAHLTAKDKLPLRNKSTNEVLQYVIKVNESDTILSDEAIFAFPDIKNMYPNVDVNEAIEIIGDQYENSPSRYGLTKESIVKALKICQKCNCVKFKGRFYLPCRGTAMGPAHGCDLTDIWIGPIEKNHVDTCLVDIDDFSIYRDDGLDILKNGVRDIPAYIDHLKTLHPNLDWDTVFGREGAYLDLFLSIENGKIETKIYKKN